ncbi:S-adenosyl-L-methionine-dependent methyltransferase [Collybia nuda]|uniref:S-adenosyl-L-methionine-dependent methyltransferase n=1 Tax=Collybia nuda TaxID=64659 RepID=A0A9P5XUM1_9AGAR|nr:S-adenosyl-L-methionine-dependent methyltransferase [Collybia nuda]
MSQVTIPGGRVDVTKVRALLRENDLTSWDDVWKAKVIPWEGGFSQPPLKEVIESGEVDFPRQGRALVPGCGSGYDAILFASSLGLDSVGMDISETAIQVANGNLAALETPPKGEVKFTTGDFLTLELPDEEKVDLIYDCAFFVAIPPSYRPAWSRQMINLIKPGGYLITLIFPMDPLSDIGPPWSVRPSHYHELLDGNFVKVVDRESEVSLPGRAGRERIAVWRRT